MAPQYDAEVAGAVVQVLLVLVATVIVELAAGAAAVSVVVYGCGPSGCASPAAKCAYSTPTASWPAALPLARWAALACFVMFTAS